MINTSLYKYGGEAPQQPAGQTAASTNNMQSGPPVSDSNSDPSQQQQTTPAAGQNPTANPMDLMGQCLQNAVKYINQMIDVYAQMSGGQNPAQSDNTMQSNVQSAPTGQPQVSNGPSGTPVPPNSTGKTASYPTWGDVFGNG